MRVGGGGGGARRGLSNVLRPRTGRKDPRIEEEGRRRLGSADGLGLVMKGLAPRLRVASGSGRRGTSAPWSGPLARSLCPALAAACLFLCVTLRQGRGPTPTGGRPPCSREIGGGEASPPSRTRGRQGLISWSLFFEVPGCGTVKEEAGEEVSGGRGGPSA